jgi:glycosyltransferase involved in cell wall biosynthesis
VDTNVFHPVPKEEVRERLGVLPGESVILFFGKGKNLKGSPYKDHKVQGTILERLAQAHDLPPIHIFEVGAIVPGVYRIGPLKVQRVPFQEEPRSLAQYYQVADLYIHPSRAETFPLAILEAMACGTPVVSTAVGGVPEQVIDGETGYLVAPGDWGAMVERIINIVKNTGLREAMIDKGIKRVKERFDLQAQVNAHLEYYQEILSHRGT